MSDAPRAAPAILVVDDDAIVRESLGAWFRADGYEVDIAASAQEALKISAARAHAVALVDVKMPGMDGLELQSRLATAAPDTSVIIMTAYATVETAVRALKSGAYDYIVKPFDPDELSHLIKRALEHRALRSENLRLKESLAQANSGPDIVGTSPAARRILELIETVAASDSTVLVRGESGTGKELVARAIHNRSPRRCNPIVIVHCGALAEGVLESELFGHEKGAFTGAQFHHKGKFEQAEGGTVFLDEIGDVSARVQVELLRVLEEKRITRVGATRSIPVDFRIIAATNRDLEAMARAGEFREDLFWRLNVVPIVIPPLRERPEDVPLIANHFLERFCRTMGRKPRSFSATAVEAMKDYGWPGNIRELQNAIERAVVLGDGPTVELNDLPRPLGAGAPPARKGRTLAEVEIEHIRAVLDETGWNITQAARILDVDRGTLYNRLHRHDLVKPGDGG